MVEMDGGRGGCTAQTWKRSQPPVGSMWNNSVNKCLYDYTIKNAYQFNLMSAFSAALFDLQEPARREHRTQTNANCDKVWRRAL